VTQPNQSANFNGNCIHVTLHIVNPDIYKQCLQV